MIMFKQKDEKVRKHIAFEDNATIKQTKRKIKALI